MLHFILSRVGYSAVSLFLLSLTIFTVVRATGVPAVLLVGPGGTRDDFAQARAHWGLDRPWPEQYLAFVGNAARGDLGILAHIDDARQRLAIQRGFNGVLVMPLTIPIREHVHAGNVGWLAPGVRGQWAQGRLGYLEAGLQARPEKVASALELLRRWAERRGLEPSETVPVARTRDRRPLRFTESGGEREQAYRMEWLSPDLSLFGCADIVADFLDALDLNDATLVANDTGGAISQAVVASRPERIGRLVLTSCDAFENLENASFCQVPIVGVVLPIHTGTVTETLNTTSKMSPFAIALPKLI